MISPPSPTAAPPALPTPPPRPIEILLVEDNPGDVRLLQETLKEIPLSTTLHVVEDGPAALNFLRQMPPHTHAPRPDLVLLDLELPGLDGRELLHLIRTDAALTYIPVAVISCSQAIEDVRRTFALQIKTFLGKPVNPSELADLLYAVRDFWLAPDPPTHRP